MDATCEGCGRAFTARRKTAKYCGDTCRQAAWKARQAGIMNGPVTRVVAAGTASVEGVVLPAVPPVSAAVTEGAAQALDALIVWLAATVDALPADQRAVFGPRLISELRAAVKQRRELQSGDARPRGALDDARARRAAQAMGLPEGALAGAPPELVTQLLNAHRTRTKDTEGAS